MFPQRRLGIIVVCNTGTMKCKKDLFILGIKKIMEQNSHIGTETPSDYVPTSDERTFAILAHILTLVAPIIAPLIII